jgi:hypothetical protein
MQAVAADKKAAAQQTCGPACAFPDRNSVQNKENREAGNQGDNAGGWKTRARN